MPSSSENALPPSKQTISQTDLDPDLASIFARLRAVWPALSKSKRTAFSKIVDGLKPRSR